jgi:hypothetical protein
MQFILLQRKTLAVFNLVPFYENLQLEKSKIGSYEAKILGKSLGLVQLKKPSSLALLQP